ncbi:hypothetical protein ACWD4J_30270 [Streptomyces sp. NPDC002577]
MGSHGSSDRTSNEISDGSQVGGDAYQAKNMHFGAHRAGFIAVAVVAVVGLMSAVALALINKSGDDTRGLVGAPQPGETPTSASASPSQSAPSPTADSPSTTPSAALSKSPASKPTNTVKAESPIQPFTGSNIYCGEWRSQNSDRLQARSCVRIDGYGATFGVAVKNVGKSQVTVSVLVQYNYGSYRDCSQGRYSVDGVIINPDHTWFSDLGQCSAANLTDHNFQTAAWAIENPDGSVNPKVGDVRYSPTMFFDTKGQPICKIDGNWGSCDSMAYVPGS